MPGRSIFVFFWLGDDVIGGKERIFYLCKVAVMTFLTGFVKMGLIMTDIFIVVQESREGFVFIARQIHSSQIFSTFPSISEPTHPATPGLEQ